MHRHDGRQYANFYASGSDMVALLNVDIWRLLRLHKDVALDVRF
jgi:hypothetical protein